MQLTKLLSQSNHKLQPTGIYFDIIKAGLSKQGSSDYAVIWL
jgi:hypothetical protein